MKREQIKTLKQLKKAVDERKSVVIPKKFAFSKPCSAAFIMNLQGYHLLRLFNSGMFIYEKKKNTKKRIKPMTWQNGGLVKLESEESK
jgi:hypothetical protein